MPSSVVRRIHLRWPKSDVAFGLSSVDADEEGARGPAGPTPRLLREVMEQRYRSRLPAALEDLSGPAHGTVQLPLHVVLELALYDVIGTKVRALAGRGLPRDLIDIHAASELCSNTELEALGRRHAWDEEFSLSELKERLDGAEWYDDQAFAEYGLSAEEIMDLRMWALAWADDIRQRSNTGTYDEDDEGEPV